MTIEPPLTATSDVVGAQVRRWRRWRDWTVAELAARCAAAGAPHLTGPALSSLESGRRDKATGRRTRLVSVDEWLTLTHVLNVKPEDLLTSPESNTVTR